MYDQVKTLTLAEMLMTLDGGGTVEEIQTKISDVSKAVLETGNQGSVTLKLTFARNGDHGSKQLAVKDSISAQMPKIAKPTTLFFATRDGKLTRQNPDQMPLGLGANI